MSKKNSVFFVVCEGEPVIPFYTQDKAEEYARLLAARKSNYFDVIRIYGNRNMESSVTGIKGDLYEKSKYHEVFDMFKKVKLGFKIANLIEKQIKEQPEYLIGEGDVKYIDQD